MKPTEQQAEAWTVLRTEVGSRVLGVAVEGTDDRDLLAICVEPPEWVVGLHTGMEQPRAWQYRTQPDGVRSGPGDVDLTVHPLRKWMRLALGGNPTVLMSLFAPAEAVEVTTPLGDLLRAEARRFRSLRAADAFLGYLTQQAAGLRGERSVHTNRPELVERYGYDTKFAYHAVRLGVQGLEFLETGRITLPVTDHWRSHLLAIRHGEVSLADVLAEVADLRGALSAADAPPQPDREWAERVMVDAYLTAWEVP